MQFEDRGHLIGGALRPLGANTIAVENPATGVTIGRITAGTAEDAAEALEAAKAAQKGWARKTGVERGNVLQKAAALLGERAAGIGRVIAVEQGKPLDHATMEVRGGAGHLQYHSEWARRMTGTVLPADRPDNRILTTRHPYGVVVAIVPWNFPVAVLCRKIAPALMAGNAVVVKPSELTPFSAYLVADALRDAGLPDGVLNIVTGLGHEVGTALVSNPITQLVTLTGSVGAGQSVMRTSAENLTVVSLELGGKAPFIVMEDADIEQAARDVVFARFKNAGQICTCAERVYVHEAAHDAFVKRVAELASALKMGDPLTSPDMGPVISAAQVEKLHNVVDAARKDGTGVVCGGSRPAGDEFAAGHWFSPTVLSDVRHGGSLTQEEIFGPILPVVKVASFDEAVAFANDSDFGLSAYLYTHNYDRIMRAMDEIDFGEIFVNRTGPEAVQGYHAGYRKSGIGGDDGPHGFEAYLKKRTVYLAYRGGEK